MSKRKERQAANQADYAARRAPGARWLAAHKERCHTCGPSKECNMIMSARVRGMRLP